MSYKYRQTFTVGNKPDGKPIRKEIRSNNKKEFDAKVRYYRNLYAKGVQVVGKGITVERQAKDKNVQMHQNSGVFRKSAFNICHMFATCFFKSTANLNVTITHLS